MSHSASIDITSLTDARTALICARLHLRGGKRYLQKGLKKAGLVALYDSVLFAMHYYIARHRPCASLLRDTDLWDSAALFHALARAGVFDDPLTFNRFSLSIERVLWQKSSSDEANVILAEVERMLAQLGVIHAIH